MLLCCLIILAHSNGPDHFTRIPYKRCARIFAIITLNSTWLRTWMTFGALVSRRRINISWFLVKSISIFMPLDNYTYWRHAFNNIIYSTIRMTYNWSREWLLKSTWLILMHKHRNTFIEAWVWAALRELSFITNSSSEHAQLAHSSWWDEKKLAEYGLRWIFSSITPPSWSVIHCTRHGHYRRS